MANCYFEYNNIKVKTDSLTQQPILDVKPSCFNPDPSVQKTIEESEKLPCGSCPAHISAENYARSPSTRASYALIRLTKRL